MNTYEVRVKYQSRRRKPLNTTDLYFVMYVWSESEIPITSS